MRKAVLLSAIAIMGFASCKKDNKNTAINNGSDTQQQMSYQLVAVNKSGNLQAKTTDGMMTWTSGYANPRLIKFEAKQAKTEIEYKSTNTNQIDLMTSTDLLFGGSVLPNGTYDEIELKIYLDKDGPSAALQLQGQYINGGLSFPVLVFIEDEIELKTELKNVTITDNTAMIAVTTLDLFETTAGITGKMLENGKFNNGVMEISRDRNRNMYNTIVSNLKGKKHKCNFKNRWK